MDRAFWQDKWASGQIGFHEANTHPLLLAHFDALEVPPAMPVLVPLCGKSLDMVWLRERGHDVVGVELSALACTSFFEERGLAVEPRREGAFDIYEAGGYRLLCGDIFDLAPGAIGAVGAVYDRASLIALPEPTRHAYANLLGALLAPGTRMLLVTIAYADGLVGPPPFSIADGEVASLFSQCFDVEPLATIASTVKDEPCTETAFRLTRRDRPVR